MEIFIAPVQGHTDAAWRHFHHKVYGGNFKYFTPFMRCEHGALRTRDLQDYINPLNAEINLEPQVLFRNMEELDILLQELVKAKAESINLNLGCPFPPQTGKGRGAGFIQNVSEARKLPDFLNKYNDLKFSIKMRLGLESPDEWKNIIEILNSIELENLYVHPRVARQQYKGEMFLDRFQEILRLSSNPVVFNGDIKTPDELRTIVNSYPEINGVMTARGILGRPSLASEYDGEWSRDKRIDKMMIFHKELLEHYCGKLCGESQILTKIKSFWEFAEAEIGRKACKAIKKASNMAKYNSALKLIEY